MIARHRRTSQLSLTILATLMLAITLLIGTAGSAQAAPTSDESAFLSATNSYRSQNGLPALQWDDALANIARGWSQQMDGANTLSHNPAITDQINSLVTSQWTRIGENVGFGPSVDAIQNAFLNSAPHRANILGDYNRVGIGTVRDTSGTLWVTLDFLKGPSLVTAPPPVAPTTSAMLSPASTAWPSGRVDVFQRGSDGALWAKSFTGTWSPWYSLGGYLTSEPTAASWGEGRIDVFGKGGDGAIWHRALNNGVWSGWDSLGGGFTSGPGAVSWGANRIDVFGRGQDGGLWTDSFTGSGWTGWSSLGGYITSTPDAASWASGRLDVFAIGGDNAMWHRAFTGGRWSGWDSLGGGFTSGPAATSWGANRIDVFARGRDGALWTNSWNGSRWVGWSYLGGGLASAPGAAAPAANKLSVVVRGNDGNIWQLQWTGTGWTGWSSIG